MTTTNTAGEALDLNKTRAEFEAWAEGYFMCFVLHKAGEGYASTMTQAAWEAWCAALARFGSAAPVGQQEVAEDEWRVGEFWSSSRLGKTVLMISRGAKEIAHDGAHESFIRWVVSSSTHGAAPTAAEGPSALDYRAQGRSYLLPDDLTALKRFEECASDFDSGGHDVSKPAMARLRELGVVQSIGFGRHQTTAFGDYVLERAAGEPVNLPLVTLVERNAAMSAAQAQPKDTTDTRRNA